MVSFHDEFYGIGLRDLANILFQVDYMERMYNEIPSVSLTSVAKYRLGKKEPTKYAEKSRIKGKHLKTGQIIIEKLPLLDEILGIKPRAYLISSGYTGELPIDAPIYVPASITTIYDNLPKGVTPIGDAKLKWGETPLENARKALTGTKIHILE